MAGVEVVDLTGKATECDLAEVMKRAGFRDDHGRNHMLVFLVSGRRYPCLVVDFNGECAVVASTAVKFLEAFVTGAPWPEPPFWETV